jgi:hypothetical protein
MISSKAFTFNNHHYSNTKHFKAGVEFVMAHTDIPDAQAKIASREKEVPWYNPNLGDKLGDSARALLENYSGIPAGEVEAHVYKIVRLFPR